MAGLLNSFQGMVSKLISPGSSSSSSLSSKDASRSTRSHRTVKLSRRPKGQDNDSLSRPPTSPFVGPIDRGLPQGTRYIEPPPLSPRERDTRIPTTTSTYSHPTAQPSSGPGRGRDENWASVARGRRAPISGPTPDSRALSHRPGPPQQHLGQGGSGSFPQPPPSGAQMKRELDSPAGEGRDTKLRRMRGNSRDGFDPHKYEYGQNGYGHNGHNGHGQNGQSGDPIPNVQSFKGHLSQQQQSGQWQQYQEQVAPGGQQFQVPQSRQQQPEQDALHGTRPLRLNLQVPDVQQPLEDDKGSIHISADEQYVRVEAAGQLAALQVPTVPLLTEAVASGGDDKRRVEFEVLEHELANRNEQISELREKLHYYIEAFPRLVNDFNLLQQGVAACDKENQELRRAVAVTSQDLMREKSTNSNLSMGNTNAALQLEDLKKKNATLERANKEFRSELATMVDDAEKAKERDSGIVQLAAPKVVDETIRARWIQLRSAILNLVHNFLKWDLDTAQAICRSMDEAASGAERPGLAVLREGIKLFEAEVGDTGTFSPEVPDISDRLGATILQAVIWRALDQVAFKNFGGIWGGPKGGNFSTFCHSLSIDKLEDEAAIAEWVSVRIHGASVIDSSAGINEPILDKSAHTFLDHYLFPFADLQHQKHQRDKEKLHKEVVNVMRRAVELHVVFLKSRAVFNVAFPQEDVVRKAMADNNNGGGGGGFTLFYTTTNKNFLVVEPSLTKRGTADGEQYCDRFDLVDAQVII